MCEPLKAETCKKCKSIIAEPKALIGLSNKMSIKDYLRDYRSSSIQSKILPECSSTNDLAKRKLQSTQETFYLPNCPNRNLKSATATEGKLEV